MLSLIMGGNIMHGRRKAPGRSNGPRLYSIMESISRIHNRRSIRLKGFDYSKAGAYFITVCAQHRKCLLGEITGDEMRLNDAGRMIEELWVELANKFATVKTGEYVIMPNHVHGIVVIDAPIGVVGAALCGCPEASGHPPRGAPTLGHIVDWFKTMTTNGYIHGVKERDWLPFSKKLWQRNYYEHVIRNENEMGKIREYPTEPEAMGIGPREPFRYRKSNP